MTLIEVLMVVVVIGITAAFAAPKIDVTRYRVNGAMQSVGTTFLAAQRLAVTRQHDVAVLFNLDANTIQVHDDANNNGHVDAGEHVSAMPLGDMIVYGLGGASAMTADAGPITFTKTRDGIPVVTFHRDGSASEAGIIYLTSLRAVNSGEDERDARAITIERATGRASWYSYVPPAWKRGF
jgi:prepilin-type N-terminal cleavage/methylation domain-containing protein